MVLLIVGAALLLPAPAYAYLDPGSGSLVLQAMLAGAAGAAVVIKMYWKKLVSRFRGRRRDG